MEQSTIALFIVAVVILLYSTEKLPLSVTTILAMVAMVFTGILTPAEAFSGFSSTATLLLIGITIVGEAFLTSGLVSRIGDYLMTLTTIPLPVFLCFLLLLSAVLSAFLNGLAVVAIFMPILDALDHRSNHGISRKYTYMPIAIGAVLGGNLSIIGSTSMLNASSLLAESYYGTPFSFFQPALVSAPAVIAAMIFYLAGGQRLQEKCFDFAEADVKKCVDHEKDAVKAEKKWKPYFVVFVMVLCIVGFVRGMDLGAVSLLGAMVVIISGCISKKQAYGSISWDTVFVVAGAIGFAKGMEVSGAGTLIANLAIDRFGFAIANGFGFCVVILVLSTLLSNFMSNNAAVTIIAPIALAIASRLGYNPVPLVLACGVGVNLSLATPICTACVTMTTVVGYRFKDYLRVGGLVNLVATLVSIGAFYLVYYR